MVIELREVLDLIESGKPFDITFVTADRKKGTGGEIKRYTGWVKCDLSAMPEPVLRRNKIPINIVKDHQHRQHKTKNIMNPVTRDIRKVHIRLITEFNGKRVV
jgi:hypothetical protein